MAHDGFDHICIVNHGIPSKQVICAVRQVLVQPVMQAACFFKGSAVDNFQYLVEADAAFNHPLTCVFRQYDLQIKAGAVHHFPHPSFNPTAKLNTSFPAA